jgi:hypothetical protein
MLIWIQDRGSGAFLTLNPGWKNSDPGSRLYVRDLNEIITNMHRRAVRGLEASLGAWFPHRDLQRSLLIK